MKIKFGLWMLFLLTFKGYAQNPLTLKQCEDLFQKNNLYLLAEHCNIDIAQAAVIQAKIWDQPVLSGELNGYNPDGKKYFDIGGTGQKAFAINQLFLLGGKRKKEVDFAKSHVELSAMQYEQLLRNLRSQLKQTFYSIYFNQKKINSILTQLSQLDTFIFYYNIQAKQGNIPLKDLVRLESLSLVFKNEWMSAREELLSNQETIKILTQSSASITAILDSADMNRIILDQKLLQENDLYQKAESKNLDYLLAKKITGSQELQLKWQKSLEVPDINLGAAYDQRGGAFNNQVNLTFGIPLPIWKKNTGNIKIIQSEINQSKFKESATLIEIKSQISTSFQGIQSFRAQYKQAIESMKDLNTVYAGVLNNFSKRNISMLEFTDFMESYNESILYINEVEKRLVNHCIQLNLLTNEEIYAL